MERGDAIDLAAELASSLDWWVEAGVDCLVAEEPRDWLKPVVVPETHAANPGNGDAAPQARHAEPRPDPLPDQLNLFQAWLRESDAHPYAAPNAPRLCPVGDPAAGLMIMAAMPSSEDCAAGTLLSGAAGRLFDRMLAAIGRGRDTAYIAGLSCLRPPGGRFDAQGASRCAEIARHHVALAKPKALLLLGDECAKAMFGLGAAQARGRVHQIEGDGMSVPAIVTLSPDFLLSHPAHKARAWADLQMLMEWLA